MLKDKAEYYYIQNGMNCAEAVFLGANDEYGLGLPQDSARLIAGFGGGIGCGSLCGALAGAVSVIGQMLIVQDAHKTEGFSDECKKLHWEFEERLGSTLCSELAAKNKREDGTRCKITVDLACEVLESFLKEKGLI